MGTIQSPQDGLHKVQAEYSSVVYTVNKRLAVFLSPAGMSLTKLSLAGINYIISRQGEFE